MKYIKKFSNLTEARAQGNIGLDSPHLDFVDNYTVVNSYEASSSTFTCDFDDNGKMIFKKEPQRYIYFKIATGSEVKLPSGTYEYSTDNKTWTTSSAGQSFTTNFYLRGKNSAVGRFTINGSVGIEGNAMALVDWETLPTKVNDTMFMGTFQNCTGLTGVSSDFLTTTFIGESGCESMFGGCTSLVNAPSLPSTTVGMYGYLGMFSGCTSLVDAPALPSTSLTESCYQEMFIGCVKLTKSPVLNADKLMSICYKNMFNGCTSLSTITCYATQNTSGGVETETWVKDVAPNGTFYAKNGAAWPTGNDGVPTGWTRHDI